MSRVTKLQKRNYAETHGPHSYHVRRILNHNRSMKLRAAQKQRPHRCACGHYDHGEYGCYQGCAWGLCYPTLDWMPFVLTSSDRHFADLQNDLTLRIIEHFRLNPPDQSVVFVGGDEVHVFRGGDLMKRNLTPKS